MRSWTAGARTWCWPITRCRSSRLRAATAGGGSDGGAAADTRLADFVVKMRL